MDDVSRWTRQQCAEWLSSGAGPEAPTWADAGAQEKLDRCVTLLRMSDMELVREMAAESNMRYSIFSSAEETEILINGSREKRPMGCTEVHMTFESDAKGGKFKTAEGKS
jgi:hypothetical protein